MKRDIERILLSVTLLCTIPTLVAQDTGSLVDEAAIMRHVLGDIASAKQRLESALAGATAVDRPRILAELVLVYEGSKQRADRDRTLTRLAGSAGPYAAWAKQRMVAGADNSALQDRLAVWVQALDNGLQREVTRALKELNKLGALAVPEVIRQLPAFGPTGLRNGLAFIVPFADQRLANVLRDMLSSGDPIRETVASEVLARLPAAMRTELANLAMKSRAEIVQVRAAIALVGEDEQMVLVAMERLAGSRSAVVRRLVLSCCGRKEWKVQVTVRKIVERLVADSDVGVAASARTLWLWLHGTKDTERVLRWFATLDDRDVESVIADLLGDHDLNADLLVQGLRFPSLVRRVLDQVSRDDLVGHEDLLLGALRAVPIDFDGNYDRINSSTDVLYDALVALRVKDAVPILVPILENRSVHYSGKAWKAIESIDPSVLLEQADRLEDPPWQERYLELLTAHASPQHMFQLVRAAGVILGPRNSSHMSRQSQYRFADALAAFGDRSDGSNLEQALQLVAIPEANQFTYWSWAMRRRAVIEAFARWFGREHVELALKSIGSVDHVVANQILALAQKFADAEHLDLLVATLNAARQRNFEFYLVKDDEVAKTPLCSSIIASQLLPTLARLDDGHALTALQGLFENVEFGTMAIHELRKSNVIEPETWVRLILTDKRYRKLVTAVIGMPVVAADEELRRLAIGVVGEAWLDGSGAAFFLRLSSDERLGLARTILSHRLDANVSRKLLMAALTEFGDRRSEEYVELLASGLEVKDHVVRQAAVSQLLRTYSRRIVPHLLESLKDDEHAVQKMAESALEQLDRYYTSVEKWESRLLKKNK